MSDIAVQAQGLLFDMDGVLIGSTGSVERCWRRWAEHYGLPNAKSVEIQHGQRAVDIMQQLVPGLDVAEGLRLIDDLELADLGDVTTLPGAGALLESLPGERWAIVTSATRAVLLGRLQAAGLPLPERLVSADQVVKGKPDPEPYRRGAELVGVPAGECIVVEDAPSGIRAGLAAGCRVLGVVSTHTAQQLRAAGVDWVVQSLEDVHAESSESGLALRLHTLA